MYEVYIESIMSFKKIASLVPKICFHREHNPPNMIVLQPGVYKHECPGCKKKTTFVVPVKYL